MGIFGWSYPPGADKDPLAPYNQGADDEFYYEHETLVKHLKEFDTGRCGSDADCCLTGKDADLEPWGEQGISIKSCDDYTVNCIVYIAATLAGHDVCLNLPCEDENNDEFADRAKDAYLDLAYETISICGLSGEWDGDSWYLCEQEEFAIPWAFDDIGEIDYAETIKAILESANQILKPMINELTGVNETLDMLSGWSDVDDETKQIIKCQAGQPGKYAAWLR